jgi:CO/xanthine dehydrogenase Mo-binding subunit
MEEMRLEKGRVTNPNFKQYLVPKAKDIPPIQTLFVESNDPYGPYGAKGVGEPPYSLPAPAIANAIYHATGVRIKSLPRFSDTWRM